MTPIAPLITNFLREHMPVERGYSPHTCETYAHAFRLLFVFASQRLGIKPSQLCLEQIDAALILDFLAYIEDQRGNCAATRNGRLAAIKTFIGYVELRVPSALEQARQIHAIPAKYPCSREGSQGTLPAAMEGNSHRLAGMVGGARFPPRTRGVRQR